jgi:dTMP kinase
MNCGFFITFEGCEGCGKSTQAQRLYQSFTDAGMKAVLTREPGGTALAEGIRRILLDPANRITPLAELMLYEAGRAQHAADFIVPALKKRRIVICDRFTDATLAYQGFGRGLDLSTIRKLNAVAALGLTPDLTIYLDIPVRKGLRRAKALEKESYHNGDRIEQESLAFHERVRKGYLALARREPARITVIRTAPSIEETHRLIVAAVQGALRRKRKPCHLKP